MAGTAGTATGVKIEQRAGKVCHAAQASVLPRSTPQREGMDADALSHAAAFAADHTSDSLVVVRNGKLILEQYWNGKTAADVQQTYSGTKSLFTLLVGRAIGAGYIRDLEQPVVELVEELTADQAQLTFRNVLAMSSGMENSARIEGLGSQGRTQLEIALERRIVAAPFALYHYNNAAYRLLFTALERACGMDLEALTHAEVFEPLGFDGAHWVRLYAIDGTGERFTGYQSIRMTPRDFSKSAQVIVDAGCFGSQRYLPADYVASLLRSPAPDVNPSFGLFHHLNAGSFYRDYVVPDRIERKLIPGAPADTFMQYGAGGQIVAGVPSLRVAIARTGRDRGGSIYEADNPIAELIRLIAVATADA